ncbi:MAG: FAD-dependent oxidoreductase, partial [Deltaproteobacteria bacterium]|nr:FAD-dependent oxidoreductase [Deltaproteobacteria bacterium]
MTKTVTTQSNSALVIGAGIAGIRAALDLAERGHMVYLSDLGPYAGGALVRLDRWFPDNHCGMCRVLPSFNRDQTSQHCLRRGFTHPRISFVACSELKSVDGSAGDFQVTLTLAPRRIDPDLCIGCGKCAQACPVEVPDQFNQGRSLRRAAYLPNPMSEIKLYHIDEKACTACGACLDVCPVGAVDLAATAQERLLDVGALIVTTGFEPYEAARASQYGYGRFPNVITGFDLERLMSGSGPTEGELQRPSDDKIPKSVAFIQCVGSRSLEQHYCSSACCMYALKEAIMIKECYPDVDVHIFFMDMRAFGKGYYRYYENARDTHGISMSRCRIPRVRQNFSTANLLIHAVESDGRTAVKNFDLVVLSTGQSPSVNFQNIADCADIELNDDGFCRIRELAPVAASRDGVFVCGSTTGPCDIADTLADASAAAWLAAQLLECVESPALETASAPAQDTAGCAVYLCNCGKELDLMLNFDELAVGVNQLKGVSHVEVVSNLCQAAECERVCARTAENRFAGVVLAGCSQLSAEPFAMMPACEIVNIRERLAWVHCDVTEAAGKKAVGLVGMAVQKLLNGSLPVRVQPITVVPHVTVLGGGLAGMTAARSLSRCGIDVVLVEKSEVLGGAARGLDMLLGGETVADFLDALVDDITKSPRVSLNTATTVTGISGTAGDFTVSLSIHGDNEKVSTGALIFATGATEYVPQEYLFGEHDGVMTQRDCERKLAQGQSGIKDISS